MEKNEKVLWGEFGLQLEQKIRSFHQNVHPISIGNNAEELKYFVSLMTFEAHEIKKVSETTNQSSIDQKFSDPGSTSFDPLQLAVQYFQNGETDDACWLLFLYSYIGKHPNYDWNLLRKMYFNTDNNEVWKWENISTHYEVFQEWFLENIPVIKENAGLGEHHKYSELSDSKAIVICRDMQEYILWIQEFGNHHTLLSNQAEITPTKLFQELYRSMDAKTSFNKLIKFKYLSLLGILSIFPIQPDQPYLNDFILSRRGAQHLFESKNRKKIPVEKLNALLLSLHHYLEVNHGLEVLQKVLAKWGKERFKVERQNFKRYI